MSANPSSSVGTPANPAKPAASTNLAIRFAGLDACRGLIMVGMALDHCVYLLWTGAREPSFLFWYGPFVSDETLPELVIRLIASLCAPGFFLLMGAGLTLFAAARRKQGWTEAAIGRHIAVRGAVLVALQFCVENPLWTLKPDENWMNYVGVLYALGVSMALTGILNRLAWRPLALVAGSLMVLPEVVIPIFQNRSEQLPLLVALLVLPGKSSGLVVYFACLPWLGITLVGALIARLLAADPQRGLRASAWIGAGLLAAAAILRWLSGFGNLGLVHNHGWIGALAMVKYGPSFVFLGGNAGLILLSWPLLSWVNARYPLLLKPWCVLGSCPLFFYGAHLALFATLSRLIGATRASLGAALFAWLAGLVVLWPLCRLYGRFKRTTPLTSLWRLL